MFKKNTRGLFLNLVYAFAAQGISLILSIFMTLIVPKLLGVQEFGYWQLFTFYATYIVFFQFGLSDGIYLRFGGKRYEDLDYSIIGTQFRLMVLMQIFLALVIIVVVLNSNMEHERIAVWIYLATVMVISNASTYLGVLFQTVNHTKQYSISVMIDRVILIFAVIGLIMGRVQDFKYYILIQVLSKLLSLIYCVSKGKKVVFAKRASLKKSLTEMIKNSSVGLNLMFSSIASLLIMGSGRYVIDSRWGIESFSQFSLALAVTALVLQFTAQVSVVLYPALCRITKDSLQKLYLQTRNPIGVLLSGVFLLYMPLALFLKAWLPQYEDSIQYLILMFPLCIFDSKMHFFGSLYLKVLREEKNLLKVNMIASLTSLLLSIIGAYILHNILAVVIFMVVTIALRSYLAEIKLAELMNSSVIMSLCLEGFLAIFFVATTWVYGPVFGFLAYFVIYIVYLAIHLNQLKSAIHAIKSTM